MTPLFPSSRDTRRVESRQDVYGVELEGATPGEYVKIAEVTAGFEGLPGQHGIGEEALDTYIVALGRNLRHPLKCKGGHADVVAVRIAHRNPQAAGGAGIEDPGFISEQLAIIEFHWTSIRHPVQ